MRWGRRSGRVAGLVVGWLFVALGFSGPYATFHRTPRILFQEPPQPPNVDLFAGPLGVFDPVATPFVVAAFLLTGLAAVLSGDRISTLALTLVGVGTIGLPLYSVAAMDDLGALAFYVTLDGHLFAVLLGGFTLLAIGRATSGAWLDRQAPATRDGLTPQYGP